MTAALASTLVSLLVGLTSAVWPLQPRPQVVHGFAPPSAPWAAGHRGVDLLGHPGQAVHSAEDGTIRFAGLLAGRGVVVVGHGPTRTTYEPVTATVRVGDQVRAGAVVGRLEAAPSHCFPRSCLHWGLIEGDTYWDPLSLLGARPVRLLPLGPAGLLPAGPSAAGPAAGPAVGPAPLAPRRTGTRAGPGRRPAVAGLPGVPGVAAAVALVASVAVADVAARAALPPR
jgi:hypothetical protein